jgi:hypothetical protein
MEQAHAIEGRGVNNGHFIGGFHIDAGNIAASATFYIRFSILDISLIKFT